MGCATPANNHSLDYGVDALLDTLRHFVEGRDHKSRPVAQGKPVDIERCLLREVEDAKS